MSENERPTKALPVSALQYDLPEAQIAAYPAERRDGSRLLSWTQNNTPAIHDERFPDIVDHFGPDDMLVLNQTAVHRCRTWAKTEGGGTREFLWIRQVPDGWLCFGQTRRLKENSMLDFGRWQARVVELRGEYAILQPDQDISTFLRQEAELALPPYILRQRGAGHELWPDDEHRYQTVFAERPGAVAAPTAGLHWTPELLHKLRERGTQIGYLTLHVGPGTFKPIRVKDLNDHHVDPEYVEMDEATAKALTRAMADGKRITAGGTTTTRALEGVFRLNQFTSPWQGEVDLTIVPGFTFDVVDRLLTNFHLPGSSLLALVDAFTHGHWRSIYRHAVDRHYRFYSYGDASLLAPEARP